MGCFHPLGPVQGLVRELLGYGSPRDLRLPDIRGLAGCIVLLGFVLMFARSIQIAVENWRRGYSILERPGAFDGTEG